jgi:hypothetical protein
LARAFCYSALLRGIAPFLRTCRLGCGLVCRVSAVSRGRSPGSYFPQLGPRLFVITGEAATRRSRSFPIPLGYSGIHSVTISKIYLSPLVELANTTNSVKISKKERDHRSGSGGFSEYLGGFHPLSERRCALYLKVRSGVLL